jgi:cell division protein FtsW
MLRRLDLLLLGVALVLTFFGLAMIASVTVFESYQLTSSLTDRGLLEAPSNAFFLKRSFFRTLIALMGMGVMIITPYHVWERLAKPIYFILLLSLALVFLPGIGADFGTANSWIYIGGFSLQPSEFFKLGMIFYLAIWLRKKEETIATIREGFIPFVILLSLSTFLIALHPDLGSFLVIAMIATIMFFIAGGNIVHLIVGGALALGTMLPLILQKQYVRDRFSAWINAGSDTLTDTIGYQINQALIAIGSGGLFGVGYGKGIQKFGYLPEVEGDAIFAAMSEELGFFRMLIIIGLYGIFVWRGYSIAKEAPDRFGFLVAAGVTTWVAAQSLLNVAVNLALFPIPVLHYRLLATEGLRN